MKLIILKPDIFKLKDSIDINKWRYCILKFSRNSVLGDSEILDRVEVIYADFDYAVELEGVVRYIPSPYGYNSEVHTRKGNEQHMLNELYKF